MIIRGKVHKFGDDINTDDIIAAKYLDSQDLKFLGSKCMENIDSDFSKRVQKKDIIVAGKNFGCGSSREHAPMAIKGAGVACVIAESFARIFFRNAINTGLPIVELKEAALIRAGDSLEVDLLKGKVKSKAQGKVYAVNSFPEFLREIIKKGGLIAWLKTKKGRLNEGA